MKKEMICISCPLGCHITAQWDEKEPLEREKIQVTGNQCSRGEIYGREEILEPRRVVTATCALRSPLMGRVPVKTSKSLPREKIVPLLEELYRLEVTPPAAAGDILLRDFEGTGVDVVITRSVAE